MIWEKRKHAIDHKSIYLYPQFFIYFLIKRLMVRSPERNLNLGNIFFLSFVSNEISKETKKNEYSCELITAQHKALSNFHSANSNACLSSYAFDCCSPLGLEPRTIHNGTALHWATVNSGICKANLTLSFLFSWFTVQLNHVGYTYHNLQVTIHY